MTTRAQRPTYSDRAPARAATASPVQLAAFDDAIQRLHASIQPLPHLGAIQHAFGGHDVSGIQAHVGGQAKTASDAMGAAAYATGGHVAFGGAPDLHTAAHEAAHVVQQRAGVQLAGGVGKVGDPYERHADAVADAVVQGKSAEGLLDTMAGGGRAGGAATQRQVQGAGGLLDAIKAFFTEAELDAKQQKVATILQTRHGVDVSKVGSAPFCRQYADAVKNNPKATPEQIAADIADPLRELAEARAGTRSVQRKTAPGRDVQRAPVQRAVAGPGPTTEAGRGAQAVIVYLYPSIETTLTLSYDDPGLQARVSDALAHGVEASAQIRAALELTKVTSLGSLASAVVQGIILYLRTKNDQKLIAAVKSVLTRRLLTDLAIAM